MNDKDLKLNRICYLMVAIEELDIFLSKIKNLKENNILDAELEFMVMPYALVLLSNILGCTANDNNSIKTIKVYLKEFRNDRLLETISLLKSLSNFNRIKENRNKLFIHKALSLEPKNNFFNMPLSLEIIESHTKNLTKALKQNNDSEIKEAFLSERKSLKQSYDMPDRYSFNELIKEMISIQSFIKTNQLYEQLGEFKMNYVHA